MVWTSSQNELACFAPPYRHAVVPSKSILECFSGLSGCGNNIPVMDGNRKCHQVIAAAWSDNAAAGFDVEHGPVGRAHDVGLVAIHEPVGRPVELYPCMRARIEISKDLIALPNDHDFPFAGPGLNRKSLAFAVGDIVEAADHIAGHDLKLRSGHFHDRLPFRI